MISFWQKLKKPIIGLAPMDGVTDGAMREITDNYGHPDVIFTEFIPVAAIKKGIVKVLYSLKHHKTKTPLVAQFFGNDPDAFYQSVFVAAEFGYDGVDINMGCPARSVAQRGGGAGLIKNPKLAQEIIKTCKQAAKDWKEGGKSVARSLIPISVKTRIGYDKPITEEWISQLLEMQPDAITIHGRTLKQLYHGKSDWDEIAKAAKLAKKTQTLILGNGDIKSLKEVKEKVKKYKVDGVLIGRAALGNPWVFTNKIPMTKERFQVMLEHCQKFIEYRPDMKIVPMRKHLAWYCKGFNGAAKMRDQLMRVNSLDEVKKIIKGI